MGDVTKCINLDYRDGEFGISCYNTEIMVIDGRIEYPEIFRIGIKKSMQRWNYWWCLLWSSSVGPEDIMKL
jgi:hypothetical protein